MARLLDSADLKDYEETIVGFGPRLTGSAAHEHFIEFITDKMTKLGYDVKEDKHTFNKWEPTKWALTYGSNKTNVDINDVDYYPYSGLTEEKGVSGKLCYCGHGVSYIGSRNKIAVIEIPIFEASCGLVFKKRAVYPTDFIPPAKQGSPVVATFVIAPFLSLAKAAGAKAVIAVMTGISDDNARHQYLPFIKKFAGIPALWVVPSVGKKVIEAAKRGENANVTLTGSYELNAPSRTVYAVLKGKSDTESILINTHSDGTNAFEENAPIGLISLAKYFAEKPISEREKTLIFSFNTGHFQLHQFGNAFNQATTKFLNRHREFWDGKNGHMKAVAGLTLEHLGCTEWRDTPDHKDYIKLNEVDPELVYTSNETMSDLYLDCLKERKLTRTLMLRPKNMVHFGEGQPIYKKGIPSISLCPGPDYLCNVAPNGYIDKINYDMMYEQIDTFRKVIETLDKKKRAELGKKQGFNFGLKF